jgi:peptidoglycan/xylan/chitin deacetylase (PgdA/CDA1 family)
VRDVAEKHNMKMTWFINGNSSKKYPDLIKNIAKSQDIQSHGYYHRAFKSKIHNYNNLKLWDDILKSIGIEVSGFSAPFGYWNEELGKALEKMKYLYSSEFWVKNKVLPFFPLIKNSKSRVLQVPIYPICLGNLLKRGYNIQAIKHFYNKIIDDFYSTQIPIFLYGHPTIRLGKYPEILDFIFNKIKTKDDVWFVTLTEYAKFWIKNNLRYNNEKKIDILKLKRYHSRMLLLELRNKIFMFQKHF